MKKKYEKDFLFDVLVDQGNLCNFKQEIRLLKKKIHQGRHIVLYGPRNFGKTSLLKNILIPWFRKKYAKDFVMFVDLMEVRSLQEISNRISLGFNQAYKEAYPFKNFLNSAKNHFKNIKLDLSMDPKTGEPNLGFSLNKNSKSQVFSEILKVLYEKISKEKKVFLIFDEFQDILLVQQAPSLFRQAFQEFVKVPIIISGSKQHLLQELLLNPKAPLAGFGEDIELKPIAYKEYYAYMLDRFQRHRVKLSLDLSCQLQKLCHRIPEAINRLCAEIRDRYPGKKLDSSDLQEAFESLVEQRFSRFGAYLGFLNENEELVLKTIAKHEEVVNPQAKSFLKEVSLSSRGLSLIIKRLMNKGILERDGKAYRVYDPFLNHFLLKYR